LAEMDGRRIARIRVSPTAGNRAVAERPAAEGSEAQVAGGQVSADTPTGRAEDSDT